MKMKTKKKKKKNFVTVRLCRVEFFYLLLLVLGNDKSTFTFLGNEVNVSVSLLSKHTCSLNLCASLLSAPHRIYTVGKFTYIMLF